jgi:hypothetical protein
VEVTNANQVSAERGHALTPAQTHSLHLNSEDVDHANAMMGMMDEGNQGSANNFGDSSATGFMREIEKVIDRQITPPGLQRRPSEIAKSRVQSSVHSKTSERRRQEFDYVLPPRHRADNLLSTYWRLVDTLYPFLDRTEVESLYRRLWTGEDIGDDGPVFLSLLNIIFSIACALDATVPPEERESSADIFYQRAWELLNFGFVQSRSVMTVQCFLLLGQYLQSTNDPQQCWNFVGLAIRMAQSLGLDLPSTSAQARNSQQTDLLRKVWHGCVLMDRTLSLTFGRPPMITSRSVTLVPSPVAHQNPDTCSCSASMSGLNSESSDIHFYIESLKLYEIMNEALLNLYNSPLEEEPKVDPYVVYFGSLGAKGLGLLFDRDKSLCLWNRNLPIHLRLRTNTQRYGTHQRQATVLKLRYYYIRILLYRPVLSRFCSRYENDGGTLEEVMPSKIALQCSLMCLNTAFEVIELFDSIMEGQDPESFDDVLPAWWYSIFYVYSAATVLVATLLQPAITAEVPEQAVVKSWRTAIKIMGRFQKFSTHAARYTAVLNVLFDQVPQQHRKHRNSLQQRSHGVTHQQRQLTKYSERSQDPCQVEADPTSLRDTARSIAPPNQWPATAVPTSTTNIDRSAGQAFECEALSDNGVSQPLFQSYPTSLLTNPSSNEGIFDTLELQLDPGDMSWLNSFPFQ